MPICENHHWTLLVADVKRKTISILDSLGHQNTDVENLWRKYMFTRERYAPEDLLSWKPVQERVQQQRDGHSCGVFILMFAEALLNGIPPALMMQAHARKFRGYVKERLLSNASDVKGDTCAMPFCFKPTNDVWVQCRDCLLWSHSKCSGMKRQKKDQLCSLCMWREEAEAGCH
ncbi:uncharacterized protein LOC134271331 [Saccostrea cucullata]|uniref:uncharacterized protein LOC134271331 n=1 Tax=Saccostrea cuccullata TaxID=36930 RepID=UPI002ED5E886